MSEPAAKRRWPRYSLRTLLVLVALSALMAFWLRERSERIRFEQELRERLNTRLKSANFAYEAVRAAYPAQTATFFDLLDAHKALADAEMALATKPEEEIAALQSNVDRLTSLERLIKQKYATGHAGGEANVYWSVKRDRETAEIALLKAQFQAGIWRGPTGNDTPATH